LILISNLNFHETKITIILISYFFIINRSQNMFITYGKFLITFCKKKNPISKMYCTLAGLFIHKPSMENKKDVNLLRINRRSILFNNKELRAIESYCQKYRINNRSKFMREAIITSVLKKFDEDYPTLF